MLSNVWSKRFISLALILMISIVGFVMLGNVGADTDPANDTLIGAETADSAGGPNAGTLSSTDTVDWFKVPSTVLTGGATGASNVTITYDLTVNSAGAGSMTVLAKDGLVIYKKVSTTTLSGETFWFYSLDGLIFYILMESDGADISYDFSITLTSGDNPRYDGIDSPGTAVPVVDKDVVDDYLHEQRDYFDVYEFTADEDFIVNVTIDHPTSGAEFQTDIFLYNSSTFFYDPMGATITPGASQDKLSLFITVTDTYYLFISAPTITDPSAGNVNGGFGAYSLNFSIRTTINILPLLSNAYANPHEIPDHLDTGVLFSVKAVETDGAVLAVDMESSLWSGKISMNGGTGGVWNRYIIVQAANHSGVLGSYIVTYTAYDDFIPQGSNSTQMNISVVWGNREPESTYTDVSPHTITVDEDAENVIMNLTELVTDDDETVLEFQLMDGGNWGQSYMGESFKGLMDDLFILNLTFYEDDNGVEDFLVNCSDGQYWINFSIRVDVTPVNDGPGNPYFYVLIEDADPDTSGVQNLTARFVASSPSDPDGEINFTFKWDFEDDGTVDEQGINLYEVEHTYPFEGYYDVLLTVEDQGGETNDYTDEIYVEETKVNEPKWLYSLEDDPVGTDTDLKIAINSAVVTEEMIEEGEGWLDFDTINKTYEVEGTCGSDVNVVYVYYGVEEESYFSDETYFDWNYIDYDEAVLTPEGGKWSLFFNEEEDEYEYEGYESMRILAIGWGDSGYNVATKDAVYTYDAEGPPAIKWWDELDIKNRTTDSSVTITFDTCTLEEIVEKNTPRSGKTTVTTKYTFSGTCGEDVDAIHIYRYDEFWGDDYRPFDDENNDDLEIHPGGTEWSVVVSEDMEWDTEDYDMLSSFSAMLGLDREAEEEKTKFAAVAWTEDFRYNIDETNVDFIPKEKDDDDDDGFLAGLFAAGFVCILVPIIVFIQQATDFLQMTVMCSCSEDIPAGQMRCPSCGANRPPAPGQEDIGPTGPLPQDDPTSIYGQDMYGQQQPGQDQYGQQQQQQQPGQDQYGQQQQPGQDQYGQQQPGMEQQQAGMEQQQQPGMQQQQAPGADPYAQPPQPGMDQPGQPQQQQPGQDQQQEGGYPPVQ